ncbi:MAG: tetratricopeptide repeat-containing diguanylate cyclase [Pseudomonadota bacterium]
MNFCLLKVVFIGLVFHSSWVYAKSELSPTEKWIRQAQALSLTDPINSFQAAQNAWEQLQSQPSSEYNITVLLLLAENALKLAHFHKVIAFAKLGLQQTYLKAPARIRFLVLQAQALSATEQIQIAEKQFKTAVDMARAWEIFDGLATALAARGLFLAQQLSYQAALRDVMEAYSYIGSISDVGDKLNILKALANTAQLLGNHQDAIRFERQVLEIATENQITLQQAVSLAQIAVHYKNLNDTNEAESYFKRAVFLYRELGDKERLAQSLKNLAGVSENIDAGLSYIEEAINLIENNQMVNLSESAYRVQAGLFLNGFRQNVIKQDQIEAINDKLKNYIQQHTIEPAPHTLKTLAEIANALKDYETAYRYLDAFLKKYQQQILRERGAKLEKVRVELETETVKLEKAVLIKENAMNQKIIMQKQQINDYYWYAGHGFVLFIALLLILLYKNHSMRKSVEKLSLTDELTSIYNRRAIGNIMDSETARSRRYKHPLTLGIIDIDHFKNVNDKFGHDIGDLVLKQVANLLKENCRQQDYIGRWGGEEFGLCLVDTTVEQSLVFSNRLREIVASRKIPQLEGQTITLSIGLSEFSMNEESKEEILKRADEALYQAKESGRNCVVAI